MKLKIVEMLWTSARFMFDGIGRGNAAKGLFYASVTFLIRSTALGLMLPLILRDVVAALSSTPPDTRLLNQGLLSLGLVAVSVSASEWLMKPFWQSMASGIVGIKRGIVNRAAPTGGDSKDVIGRIVSDVDFVIWNNSSSLTVILPNFLTTLASFAAMIQLSPRLSAIAVSIVPPLLVTTELYVRKAEQARNIERSFYSQSIHFAERLLNGGRDQLPSFQTSLEKWLSGISRLIQYDRLFWFSGLLFSSTLPFTILWVGIGELNAGRLDVGALAGSLYASVNYSMALVNGFWGLCMLGQSLAAIRRVEALGGARIGAA
ncbi:MAG: ABC transporter transmembrane domain-containing protein [Nitrososphaerota archaeon]|nr:ABC transporter transmembrane domain-containing protein [Candidatus Calditenuaceae archaeon]MDW8073929.1 ABC transporter transmembrane domain-containing protein [Nitrososphaerota archaeon]